MGEDASKKDKQEIEQARQAAVVMMRHHQDEKKLSVDGLFAEFDADKDDRVDEKEFSAFFAKCEKPKKDGEDSANIPAEDLSRLFGSLDEEDAGAISKEIFYCFIRRHMKVVKETVMTEDMPIKDTKTVRRLELNEVCEVLEGPVPLPEDDTGIKRVKVKTLKDNKEGWCTPVGNQGTAFLTECDVNMKVLKETIMTPTFEIAASKETLRKLKPGEIVEVREWMKKDEASGLMRAKVKTKTDGKVGWATAVGNAAAGSSGNVFLELV